MHFLVKNDVNDCENVAGITHTYYEIVVEDICDGCRIYF